MRSRGLKRLVVNASVAKSAGGKEATALVSVNCTEFLETFRDECPHHIVMTPELSEEWNEHQSNFASTWLKSMIAKKRFVYIMPFENKKLSDEIEATAIRDRDINALRKDFHLIQAALATDRCVVSLDETIRSHFKRAARSVSDIREVVWVNPNRTEEQPLLWLQNGAPSETGRQLFGMGV